VNVEQEQALARIAELEGQVAALSEERTALVTERDALTVARDGLLAERDGLTAEQDGLAGEREALAGRAAELEAAQAALANLKTRLVETASAQTALATDLDETRARSLGYLRRALLAEHAGQVVPELIEGSDEASLVASVEAAKQAYARALDAARTAIVSQTVPAGAPSARVAPVGGLSPLEMIESGLRR
jgi:hypothetical protein